MEFFRPQNILKVFRLTMKNILDVVRLQKKAPTDADSHRAAWIKAALVNNLYINNGLNDYV